MAHPLEIQRAMETAAAHHRAGRLREAEEIYRQVLAAEPNHAMAIGLLGVIAHQTGHCVDAEALLTRALRLAPQAVMLWNNLGVVQMERNRLPQARASFERAIALDARLPAAFSNLGRVHAKLGRMDEATKCFERALALSPEDPDALTGIGEALFAAGKIKEAGEYHRRVLARHPNHAHAHNNLGKVLEREDPRQAAEHFTRATELQPNFVEPWTCLAGLFTHEGKPTEAIAILRRALELNPRSAEAHHEMGRALMSAGRVRESIEHRRRAVALDPDDEVIGSGLLWALNYDADAASRAVFEEHVAWGARHADAFMATVHVQHDRTADRRPLRIGYLSGDFREHAVAHFIDPVLAHHDPHEVSVFCYSTSRRSDQVTERLRSHARGGWRDITNMPDELAAQVVRDDRIDVLIDLAGHTRGNCLRLFARKAAAVQATWIGYSATTGVRAMDYWITDALLDPPGHPECLAVEKLWRLPQTFACYAPPQDAPAVVDAPATRNGYVTFGSFNRAAKLNDRVLDLWARVMAACSNARLMIMLPSVNDPAVMQEIAQRLTCRGVARERIEIRPLAPMREYLAAHADVDVVLDTFPFNGHTTTLHALWMGTPVLTLAGQTHVSRRGVSVLTNLGLDDWIAGAADDYVDIAVRAAGDVKRLGCLRREMRDRMLASPIMRYDAFVRELENAFGEMWRCSAR